jgi:polyisoprenoid-binding protein YceI
MTATMTRQDRPRRRRRWLRWVLVSAIALVVVLVGAVMAAVKLQPTVAPLALPASVAPPSGPLDGPWSATTGSTAGFRIRQTVLGMTSDIVGRTADVTGTATASDGRFSAAHLRINLLAITSGGKPAPQFAASLDTSHFPDATVDLTDPIAPGPGFTSGAVAAASATGRLTLHGQEHAVTVSLSMRRDGAGVVVTGSFPVAFADWAIAQPSGYGWFGSLANHGTAEFLIVLHRS